MAQLPGERFLIQQIGENVIVFHRYTDEQIVKFDPSDQNATAQAQEVIHNSQMNEEEKCFAHFWAGYFYAHATF